MRTITSIATVVILSALTGCGGPSTTERLGLAPPETISGFELERYLGRWYEIASYPQPFQEGCAATTATYGARDDGQVDVTNRCLVDGDEVLAQGLARPVALSEGKLEVSFFVPIWGDYWVLELGDDGVGDYTHSVVGAPSRDALWILSRTPTLDDDTLAGILERNDAQGFDEARLQWTDQSASVAD